MPKPSGDQAHPVSDGVRKVDLGSHLVGLVFPHYPFRVNGSETFRSSDNVESITILKDELALCIWQHGVRLSHSCRRSRLIYDLRLNDNGLASAYRYPSI